MVHAQLNAKSFHITQHDADTVADAAHADGYQVRGRLSKTNAGDVYAAMSCFGLCAENVPDGGKSAVQAAAEVDLIETVERGVIRDCSVAYDLDRDSLLYKQSEEVRGIADPVTGVIKTRHTGAGAHFMKTRSGDGPTSNDRLDAAIIRAIAAYSDDPGALADTALDPQDMIYIVDNGHVHVPVLSYEGTVCIDYTSGTCIRGIMVVSDLGVRDCTTRDLYSLPDVTEIVNAGFTRRVRSEHDAKLDEPPAHLDGTQMSAGRLYDWLAIPNRYLHKAMGYDPADQKPFPSGQNGEPMSMRMLYGRGEHLPLILNTARSGGERSLLGAPLPLQIVSAAVDPKMVATVRVAPLVRSDGATHSATVTNEHAGVDMDELAARVARTGARNVIGIAMQKIEPNAQGDLMLHDGV
jgi:hypothetical protein